MACSTANSGNQPLFVWDETGKFCILRLFPCSLIYLFFLKEKSMRKYFVHGAAAAGLIAALGLTGCEKKPAPPKDGKEPAKTTSVEPKSEEEKIAAAIAELPEAERAAATAQKTCPVGDAALGSMGMPIKVTVKGQDVYLCCEGCKETLEKNADKYLAKMAEKK